jgi:hypothetical protein
MAEIQVSALRNVSIKLISPKNLLRAFCWKLRHSQTHTVSSVGGEPPKLVAISEQDGLEQLAAWNNLSAQTDKA